MKESKKVVGVGEEGEGVSDGEREGKRERKRQENREIYITSS